MKASEALEQAWELLQVPGVWTNGVYARNSEGLSVSASSREACKFCSFGALYKVTGEGASFKHKNKAFNTLKAESIAINQKGIVAFNDEVESVQDLAPTWEAAIKKAKDEESRNS